MTQQQVDLQRLLELEQQRHYQDSQVAELEKATTTIQDPLAETMKSLEKELNLDIFLSDNVNKKKQKSEINKYSSTKVKARNFLTNVSYSGIKNKDYHNKSFVIDIFSFLILYLNSFYLERKFETIIERDYINVLWSFLMPETLYNFICKDENVKTLNKIKIKFPHAIEIINLFIEDESIGTQEQHFNTLKEFLIKNAKIYQFIFGNLFPKCFARIDDYGIQSKTAFNFHYRNYLAQKNIFEWQQKNSFLSLLNDETTIENASASSTPLNMTKLNDDDNNNVKIKKEIENDEQIIFLGRKKNAQKLKEEKKKEKKITKRNEKKRMLEKKLNENTEKIQKIKKLKINK